MPPSPSRAAGWPAPHDSVYFQHIDFLARQCGLIGGESTISITTPDRDGAILATLSTLAGTVTARSSENVQEVRISISRQESDEEWAYDATRRIYRWMTGPTGQWLSTRLAGETWSAPSTAYTLPAERDLPNGNYVIYGYLVTTSGARSEQIRRTFTIAR